jgi:hypothetical protein
LPNLPNVFFEKNETGLAKFAQVMSKFGKCCGNGHSLIILYIFILWLYVWWLSTCVVVGGGCCKGSFCCFVCDRAVLDARLG